MKIIGVCLICIGVCVGIYALNIDTTPTSYEEYNEGIKDLKVTIGASSERGLTPHELMEKKSDQQKLYMVIGGVLFLSGIILVSVKGKAKNNN